MSYQVDRPSHLFHDSCTPSALMKDTFSVTLPVPSTAGDTILGPYYDHRSLFDTSSHHHDMTTPAAAATTTATNGWMLSPVPEHHHAAAASLANIGSNNNSSSSIGVNNHGPSPPPAAVATHRAPLPTPPLSSVESHQHHHQHHHHSSPHFHFPSWSSAMNNNNNTALIPPASMTYWLYPAQHNLHHASPVKDHNNLSATNTRRHKPSSPSPSNAKSTNKSANSSSTPPRRYKCNICVKRFSRPSSLATHMHSHTGEVIAYLYKKRYCMADGPCVILHRNHSNVK